MQSQTKNEMAKLPPKLVLLPGYPRNVQSGAPGGLSVKNKSFFQPFRKNQVSMPFAYRPVLLGQTR